MDAPQTEREKSQNITRRPRVCDLRAQGDPAGARSCLERALAIQEQVLGPEHPKTAKSLSDLGALLQVQGDLAGVRSCLERALAIQEQVLGPDHPETATSLSKFGTLLWAQGDLAGANSLSEGYDGLFLAASRASNSCTISGVI